MNTVGKTAVDSEPIRFSSLLERRSPQGLHLLSGEERCPLVPALSSRYAGVDTLTVTDLPLRDLRRKGLELFFFGGGGTRVTVSSHAILA